MIKIQYVGDRHHPALIRSKEEQNWLNTPSGMAGRMGSGPHGATCLSCAHLDLLASKFSDRGKAAPCVEARRLRHGKRSPEIPVHTAACNHYAARLDATALADADQRLAERLEEKRADIKRLKATLRRLDEEIHELELERRG